MEYSLWRNFTHGRCRWRSHCAPVLHISRFGTELNITDLIIVLLTLCGLYLSSGPKGCVFKWELRQCLGDRNERHNERTSTALLIQPRWPTYNTKPCLARKHACAYNNTNAAGTACWRWALGSSHSFERTAWSVITWVYGESMGPRSCWAHSGTVLDSSYQYYLFYLQTVRLILNDFTASKVSWQLFLLQENLLTCKWSSYWVRLTSLL